MIQSPMISQETSPSAYPPVNGSLADDQPQQMSRVNGYGTRNWPGSRKPMRRSYGNETTTLPLAEAARQELAANPGKTPVSILQELLSRRGITPNYELLQTEGAIHEPTFRFRVSVGELLALGFGRSKKVAKHVAAKNILDRIMGNPVTEENTTVPTPAAKSDGEDGVPGNPIGRLQELCMSRRWPPPLYELAEEEGLPHERQFTMACVVGKWRQVGSGKSKKIAKRLAAYKMLEVLAKENTDETETATDDRYAALKACKVPILSGTNSVKVSQFHKTLKGCKGVKLDRLKVVSLNKESFNAIQFLYELGTEQKFEVTFVDIEEATKDGKAQCLVQISTMPVAVCCGSGDNLKDAQRSAALCALEYLRQIIK